MPQTDSNPLGFEHIIPGSQRTITDERLSDISSTSDNSQIPISILPHELLASIFHSLSTIDRPRRISYLFAPEGPRRTRNWIGWFHVTHVCRHWRQVALATSSLWCDIDLDLGSKWALEKISRAEMAPLNINFAAGTTSKILRQKISSHISHISRICISGKIEDVYRVLYRLVKPAPLISVLLHSDEDPLVIAIAPKNLFAGQAPALRVVHVHNAFISWTSRIYAGLIELCVQIDKEHEFRDDRHPNIHPSMTVLLDALETMPNLKRLTLLDMIPKSGLPNDTVVACRRALLPNLSRLRLSRSVISCISLLRHLDYPETTDVGIDCVSGSPLATQSVPLLPRSIATLARMVLMQPTLVTWKLTCRGRIQTKNGPHRFRSFRLETQISLTVLLVDVSLFAGITQRRPIREACYAPFSPYQLSIALIPYQWPEN
ncbi:hypothetical protein EVG20_g7197 [Dentipellis fragilis]|uniref:F-box domain-containing protein n=1 Tax=Dentipellis fragilis TaxID=205917 RepID=A0A4Y9YES9_9AGAM|nr:hypothetical protein EVG20_g7197 [Dentipellis fragilis]